MQWTALEPAGLMDRLSRSRLFTPLCGLMTVLCLLPPKLSVSIFLWTGDSFFNLWFANLYASLLREGVMLPNVLNHAQYSLNPLPSYYGSLLHMPAGFLTLWLKPATACWMLFVGTYWMQYVVSAHAIGLAARSRVLGNMVAAIMLFSSYNMVTLYIRGAMAEFVGISLAVTGVCALLALCLNPERKREYLALATACIALLPLIHPITAMFTVVFQLPLTLWAGYTYFFRKREKGDALFAGILLAALLLTTGHFIYLTLRTHLDLFITHYTNNVFIIDESGRKVTVVYPLLDNLLMRLSPLPLSAELFGPLPPERQVTLLVMQINVALLLLAGYLVYYTGRNGLSQLRWNTSAALLWCAATLLMLAALGLTFLSTWPNLFPPLFPVLKKAQFPYRLIAPINLLLLVSVCMAFRIIQPEQHVVIRRATRRAFYLACCGILVYYGQIFLNDGDGDRAQKLLTGWQGTELSDCIETFNGTNPLQLPGFVYGYSDYGMYLSFQSIQNNSSIRKIPFNFIRKTDSAAQSDPVELQAGERVTLGILAHIWNRIRVTNLDTEKTVTLNPGQLGANAERPPLFSTTVTESGRYVFTAEFQPPKTWLAARMLFPAGLLMLLSCALWAAGRLLWRPRGRKRNPPPAP